MGVRHRKKADPVSGMALLALIKREAGIDIDKPHWSETARAAGVSVNTLRALVERNKLTDQTHQRMKAAHAALVRSKHPVEQISVARQREMMLGAVQVMSESRVAELFRTFMEAAADDLSLLFGANVPAGGESDAARADKVFDETLNGLPSDKRTPDSPAQASS